MGPKSLISGRLDASVQAWWRPDALKVPAPLEAAAKPLTSGHHSRASGHQNFVADVRNILSSIRQKPNQCAWVLVALLPVGPKRVHKTAGWSAAQQKRERLETTHNLLRHILNTISNAMRPGITTLYGDGMKTKCYIRVVAWLADYMKYCTIHALYNTRCSICECPADELGDHSKSYPPPDHKSNTEWVKNSNMEKLKATGVKVVSNTLWTLRDVLPSNLIQPYLLHNLFLGIIEHLIDWVEGFLTVHN